MSRVPPTKTSTVNLKIVFILFVHVTELDIRVINHNFLVFCILFTYVVISSIGVKLPRWFMLPYPEVEGGGGGDCERVMKA